MRTPAGVVQSSARRSIHLSLMIVDERFTVQDLISKDFFIPVPRLAVDVTLLLCAQGGERMVSYAYRQKSLELRTKSTRGPAKIVDRRGGIKNHILRHTITHGNVRIGDERSRQSERSPPYRRRHRDDPTPPIHSIKNTSDHLPVGNRIPPRNCIDLVDRCRAGGSRK